MEARNRLYLVELQDLEAATTQRAVQDHIKANSWYPTISDIRKQYDAIGRRTPWKAPALPPAGEGYATRGERAKQARETVEKIRSCDHVELAKAGKLKPDHPCFRQCVHAKAYFEARR